VSQDGLGGWVVDVGQRVERKFRGWAIARKFAWLLALWVAGGGKRKHGLVGRGTESQRCRRPEITKLYCAKAQSHISMSNTSGVQCT
jgi:hypothetical protein